jgi:hypothetical protein
MVGNLKKILSELSCLAMVFKVKFSVSKFELGGNFGISLEQDCQKFEFTPIVVSHFGVILKHNFTTNSYLIRKELVVTKNP